MSSPSWANIKREIGVTLGEQLDYLAVILSPEVRVALRQTVIYVVIVKLESLEVGGTGTNGRLKGVLPGGGGEAKAAVAAVMMEML